MRSVSRQVGIWTPPGQRPGEGVLALAAEVGAVGGAKALDRWLGQPGGGAPGRAAGGGGDAPVGAPGRATGGSAHAPAAAAIATAVAYAHGERHDLWWEFSLSASFRWQAHIHRMNPAYARLRLARLASLFGLTDLMSRRVESLSPGELARANLAVALLPQPELLVWEEPFRTLPGPEWMQLCRIVRRLCRTEGLTVIMVAEENYAAPTKEETTHDWPYPSGADHPGDSHRAWAPRGRIAAAGTRGT